MFQHILTDLNGNVHGEADTASEQKVVIPHMRVPSASFSLPLDHYLADTVMNTDCLLKTYRIDPIVSTKTLAFHGPVVSSEEASSGDGQGIAVVAAGPYWRLGYRFVGKTKAGFALGMPTPIDLGLAAHNILDTTNAEAFTGISKGSRSAVTTGGFGPWWLKNVAEGIAELHVGVNSFEYVVDPTEPTDVGGVGGWPQIGSMRIASLIGSARPDCVFEYGTERPNISEYSRAVTREGQMNRGIVSVSGWPDGAGVADLITRTDSASVTARGLFEAVVPDAGVTDATLRQSIADFHLIYRKNPKQVVLFKPSVGSLLTPLVSYSPGDTVRGRAMVNGVTRFDASFRVWGITMSTDANGVETTELELVMP